MKAFSGNITPDSFSGAIFAVEGILDACTVLNGPTGCKFYHSAIAGSQFQRFEGDPLSPLSEFHFGMPRIPTTYLDGNDYVFSGREKLERLLRMAAGGGYGLIAVINSPGAALIGDDLTGFLKRTVRGTPCFTVEAAGFSDSFGAGYQRALAGAIDALRGPAGRCPERRARTVNLLGLGIYQRYHEGDRHALERLLRLCGVDVLSVPGAGDKAASLARLGQAALNVVVYPEYGMDLAEKLRADYGTPALVAEEGPPLGFDGTESFLRQVSAALDMDPAPALDCIEKARARAYGFLARFTTLLGFPKGALFSLKAEPSTAYALTRWLSSYLGMIPQAISLNDEGYSPFAPRLKTYLDSINRGGALTSPLIKSPCHLFFGDANTIAALRLEGQRFCGIEIAMPSISYVDVTEKSLLGEQGALFLLEQVLNGLRYVLT
ncbi:MAG: nitrogenase component 1 [Spirochaetaceae bacterium]|jgi:nitrogenase molybdenum-iron protein alpha/beta subunit|nr:nitrogenase component 1 [Spirochaetaceae bacterium]